MTYTEKLAIEKQIKSLGRKYNKLMKEFFAIEKELHASNFFEKMNADEMRSKENRMEEIRTLTSPLCDKMEELSDSI